MEKYYIPTSTLNFNNILSSESISPKAFYEKRGFGYSRWTTVPENPFNNAIVLYDNLCFFDRPQSDLEDHPMLIEIEIDEEKITKSNGFWYSDRTIFLSPSTAQFLFFTEKDRKTSLSMSASSLETKLLRLYSRQILTIQKPLEVYKPISLGEPCGLNEREIEKDARINKMKGILYGYYIGSMLSTDSDSVKHLNVLKEIHNIFAAILSSFDKRPTAYQNERLDILFDYLNEQNADFKSLYEIISSSIDNKSKTKRVWSWIFGKRGYVKYEDKSVWLPYLQHTTENDNKENQAITWIKSNIEETKRQMYAKRHLLSPDEGEIVIMDNYVSSLKNPNIANELESRLCVSWMNETLSDKNTNGKISTYREELAKNITLKAKEVYQDTWENCQTRAYLNDLRRHIAGSEFNHEWNNGLLSSIAAVLVAGDDWEKLLSFMQNKEMTDYKLAFAFYGALNGFANLTRDFTDLFYSQEKNYVWEVYKEFYAQLFGEGLPERNGEESYGIKTIEQPVNSDTNIVYEDTSSTETSTQQTETPTTNTGCLEHKVSSLPEELKIMFDSDAFKKLSLPAQQYFKAECLKLYTGRIDKAYIEALKRLEYPKSKTNWQNAIKVLNPKQKKATSKMSTDILSLFPITSTGLFLNDFDFLTNNIEFRNLVSSVKGWEKDLKWFIDAHNPNHEDYKYYQGKPTDNESVIKQFIFLKREKYKNTESFLRRTYLK